ncbi:MAG: site-specific integrase [Clostridiales bacterium]|nr:site-specific integrase [Clostridiales bacterium]
MQEEIQEELNKCISMHSKMTLNELFDYYMSLKIRTKKITAKTANNYQSIWGKNVRQRANANLSIVDLRRNHFITMYQDMIDAGVGNGSVTLIHKNVTAILNYAVLEDYIIKNYAKGCIKELDVCNNKREALTIDEQTEFLKFVLSSKRFRCYYYMFVFMFETACRGSELCGLTWNDIDLQNKFVNIDHQLLFESYKHDSNDKKYQIRQPKTRKGIRKIPLSQEAIHALKMQKEYMFRVGQISNYNVDGYEGFIFLTSTNKLLKVTYIDYILKQIINTYNEQKSKPTTLPNITAHILRHTACTRMAEAGIDIRTLQEIMGHESIAMTMKIYNHVDENRLRKEMEKLDKAREMLAL